MMTEVGDEGSKRKTADASAGGRNADTSITAQVMKKSKADKDDHVNDGDDSKRWFEAWNHYREYLNSSSASPDCTDEQQPCNTDGGNDSAVIEEENDGNFDELFELIRILDDTVPQPGELEVSMLIDYLENMTLSEQDISSKCCTIKGLLPILVSMSYLHIGSHAISMAFSEEHGGDDGMFCMTPEEYLTLSLQYCPYNAAAVSMLANYLRMNMLAPVDRICCLYVLAAGDASKIRSLAIAILNDDSVAEEVKEWVELLLLNGIVGSEFADSESGQEDEENGKKKENASDQEEKEEDEVTCSEVEATASFMASLLNSVLGRHDEALKHQKKFGISHRIHPNVWSGSKRPSSAAVAKTADGVPIPVPASFCPINGNGVLPENLYKGLCDAFNPTSPYWNESDYENRGYYSYFLDLTMKRTPKNIIEDVIFNHLLPLAKRCLSSEEGNKICGAEWWVHHRPIQANLGHQLHFDTDESLLAQEQIITHPILSSVLYLTGGSPAGSTIVFDQTPDSKQVAPKAWTSQPCNNTYMIFPGNLLHGVLPCPGEARARQSTLERLTFMVGFWTRRVPEKMKDRRLYGPCGPLPPSTSDHTWVQNIASEYRYGSSGNGAASSDQGGDIASFALPEISPAWECFDTDGDRKIGTNGGFLEIPPGLDHRFFVRNAPHCFRQSLMNRDECF